MLKRLVVLLLEFGAGLAGNLAAGWIQQDVWSNLFTPERLLGTLAGAALMLLVLAWLESERALPWNWPWHRFWYLQEVLGNPNLRRWEVDFARLELAQGPRKVPGAEVIAEGERQDLIKVLCDLVAGRRGEVRRALVLGEPGSGKTTGLERLTLDLGREGARRLGFGRPMPVLVRLGNFQEGKLLEYVGQAMQHGTKGGGGKVLGKGIEELVEQGRVVLLFDALDEALGERREVVLAELAGFLESRVYGHVPVVITSRTREDPGGRLKDLQVFEIQDLSDEAIEVFIQAYKRPEHDETEIKERLEGHGLLEPGGLGRNPFWLRLIVESGAFEGNKGQILNQAVDTLLAREWDEKPETKRSWRRVLPREEQLHETKRALAWLGYRMSVENQVAFTEDRALAELAEWLAGRIAVGDLRPQDILGLGRNAQVLVYDPGPVRVRHRLLQEFMTAWALNVEEGLLTPEFLEECVQDTDWWETLLMLGGLVQDHTALVRAVLGDSSGDRQLFLAVGLLRSVKEPNEKLEQQVVAALVESLRRGVTPEHKQAAVELARLAGDDVVEALGRLLREEDRVVKEAAVEILGEIKNGKAVGVLINLLLSDGTIEDQVANALAFIGELAVEPLIEALRDGDSQVRTFEGYWARRRAARALGKIGKPAVDLLIAALRDKGWAVSRLAAEALGKIGEPAVVPLIGALRDKDSSVRHGATEALGEIGDAQAVEPLIMMLGDTEISVRLGAARALGKIKDVRAVEPLLEALEDKGWEKVRKIVTVALREIGDAQATELELEALRDKESDMYKGVTKAGREVRDARAVEPLLAALEDREEWVVRMTAAQALGEIGDAGAVESLISALGDRHEGVRQRAAEALGKVGDAGAVEPLIAALGDRHEGVRQRAAEALGKVGDMRAVAPLIAALGDTHSWVRGGAAWALGKIRDVRAVEPLIRALRDQDSNVRQGAAWALGEIGDALEWFIRVLRGEKGTHQAVILALEQTGGPAARLLIEVLRAEKRVHWEAIQALEPIMEPVVESLIEALGDQSGGVRLLAAAALGKIADPRALPHLEQVAREDKEKILAHV